jgi:hypothetical protein
MAVVVARAGLDGGNLRLKKHKNKMNAFERGLETMVDVVGCLWGMGWTGLD